MPNLLCLIKVPIGPDFELRNLTLVFLLLYLAFPGTIHSQRPQVNQEVQSWISINSTFRFDDHWGGMADIHVRQDEVVRSPYFYFVRLGAMYWINGTSPLAFGYAHNWLAPKPGALTWQNENRIYQQWSISRRNGNTGMHLRLRSEQRWKDIITNDAYSGDKSFSQRFRVLYSCEFRVFKNQKLPALVISDELLVQAGKYVPSAFDQNRLFFGIKVYKTKDLSLDFGYMNVLQLQSNPHVYDMSHVIRLFIYYVPDLRKNMDTAPIQVYENSE